MLKTLTATLIGLALVLPALPAQEEAELVKFSTRAPGAGEFQAAMVKTENENSIRMSRDGEEAPERAMKAKSNTVRDATILEAKDGVVTRVKLHWREVTRENDIPEGADGGRRGGRRGGGKGREPMPEPTELAGKTLVLDLSGAAPVVTDEEGTAVGEGLARLVTRMETNDNRFAGWSPDVLEALGKKEFKVGETLTLSREASTKLFGNLGGGMRARGMRGGRRGGRGDGEAEGDDAQPGSNYSCTIVFKGKRSSLGHDCGLFEINVSDSSERSDERVQSTSSTTMSGEMLVGIENGWLYKLEFKGKSSSRSSAAMEERSFDMNMEGRLHVSRQVLFAQKKPESGAAN